jgi:hypothetical protein
MEMKLRKRLSLFIAALPQLLHAARRHESEGMSAIAHVHPSIHWHDSLHLSDAPDGSRFCSKRIPARPFDSTLIEVLKQPSTSKALMGSVALGKRESRDRETLSPLQCFIDPRIER